MIKKIKLLAAAATLAVAGQANAGGGMGGGALEATQLLNCRIPYDCIDKNRYPLFMAREVLRKLVQSLQTGSL